MFYPIIVRTPIRTIYLNLIKLADKVYVHIAVEFNYLTNWTWQSWIVATKSVQIMLMVGYQNKQLSSIRPFTIQTTSLKPPMHFQNMLEASVGLGDFLFINLGCFLCNQAQNHYNSQKSHVLQFR